MSPLAVVFGATLVVFALAAVWLGGWFLGLTLVTKLLLTGLVLVLVAFVWVAFKIVKMLRARSIEAALVAQGAAQLAGASAEQKDELRALQTQMQNAIASLKKSRVGARAGVSALYSLPWYVIVGPPGAGKTTAIRHSGLTFPLDHAAGYRGVGGTRNCDWWFTDDGILLDTAGRYTAGNREKDQPEWLAFLDLLKKHRKKKPLDGLLVAVALPEIAGATPARLEEIGKQIRARLDEVTTRLKLLLPVYVVFTKVDLVAGFIECWDDLRKSERGQLWGFTFPVGGKESPHGGFRAEWESLVGALHGRVLRRMATERAVPTRDAILRFPTELASLKEPLARFVDIVFQKNAFQETPLLRGVYLTSGTQTVRPMARVVGSMAEALGARGALGPAALPPPAPTGAFPGFASLAARPAMPAAAAPPPTEAKSFFLTDLFFQVMFPDATLGGLTESEKRRQTLLRGGIAGLAFLAASGLVLPAGCTFARNRELVRSTAEIGAALRATRWEEAASPAATERLGKAEARLRQLDQWREDVPVQLRWGMYSGNELFGALRDVYAAALWRGVLASTRADLEDKLRATESSPVRSTESYNRDFDTLKLYLMLGDREHLDPEWAAPRLVRQWELLAHAHAAGEGELLVPHVQYVCELVKRGELPPWKPDARLVTRARSILAQVPQVDRLYESLVRDANTEIAPIRRETVFYGSVGPFVKSRAGVKVAGAYTKQGWSRVRTLLGSEQQKLAAERWVLGEDEAQVGQAVGKLRELYFERFKNAWRDFLADIEIADPGNAEYALAELNALSEPEWPYLRLLRTLNENVTLELEEEPAGGLVQKATDKAKELLDAGAPKKRAVSPVERAFKPLLRFGVPPESAKDDGAAPSTGLAQWEALIAKLVGVLTDYRDGAASSDPTKTSETFQEAFRTTSSLLSEQDGFTRPLLSPLLMQPITLGWSNVVKDAGVAAEATWEVSVWAKWHDKLEGKYPFADARTDASLEDVAHFFGAGEGSLWAFYNESLKATLERSGNTFTPSRRFRSSIGYTGPFLDTCLKRGAEITDALFPPKGEEPQVVFDVNVHSVSPTVAEVTFEVDGAARTYKNEPEQWLRVQWPGKTHGARLRVRGAGGLDEELNRPGDFGLFHLLDAGDLAAGKAGGRADGQPTIVATWELRAAHAATVKLDLRPVRQENPLAPGYFKGFGCPRIITAGK